MNEKIFTSKQVYVLVFAIIAGIAFMETSAVAIWTSEFWREYLLKVFMYGVVVEIIVLLLVSSSKDE